MISRRVYSPFGLCFLWRVVVCVLSLFSFLRVGGRRRRRRRRRRNESHIHRPSRRHRRWHKWPYYMTRVDFLPFHPVHAPRNQEIKEIHTSHSSSSSSVSSSSCSSSGSRTTKRKSVRIGKEATSHSFPFLCCCCCCLIRLRDSLNHIVREHWNVIASPPKTFDTTRILLSLSLWSCRRCCKRSREEENGKEKGWQFLTVIVLF